MPDLVPRQNATPRPKTTIKDKIVEDKARRVARPSVAEPFELGRMSHSQHHRAPASTHRVTSDQRLSFSLENGERLKEMIFQFADGLPDADPRIKVATSDFRDQIDEAVGALVELLSYERLSSEEACQAFNRLRGYLNGCKVTSAPGLSELERLAVAHKQEYRRYALAFAEAGSHAFAVPSRKPRTAANIALHQSLQEKANEAQGEGARASLAFARFLGTALPSEGASWNPVTYVTALRLLNDIDREWVKKTFAPQLCDQLIGKLHTIANKEVFDGQAICLLTQGAPALADAVCRLHPRNPQLEKMLFNALSKAVEFLDEKPDERYADRSFLYPLRALSSRNLTNEGAAALCTYVAQVNHLLSQMSYRDHLSTIAGTFHAINGISSWALSPDSDAKVTVLLTNLNDRLSRTPFPMKSIAAGSIIYGLKGLDLPNLSPEARTQAARTMNLLAEKIATTPPDNLLSYQAVSSIVHGLTVTLATGEGQFERPAQNLLNVMHQRLPLELLDIDQIGAMTGALVTLHPYQDRYRNLCDDLFALIENAPEEATSFAIDDPRNLIAWQTIQHAYSLFDAQMPPSLTAFVEGFRHRVESMRRYNLSEQRVLGFVRQYPGLITLNTPYIDGFEIDILARRGDTLVNIEVDGAYHSDPAKKIADAQRDDHLRRKLSEYNFDIVRVGRDCGKRELLRELDRVFASKTQK